MIELYLIYIFIFKKEIFVTKRRDRIKKRPCYSIKRYEVCKVEFWRSLVDKRVDDMVKKRSFYRLCAIVVLKSPSSYVLLWEAWSNIIFNLEHVCVFPFDLLSSKITGQKVKINEHILDKAFFCYVRFFISVIHEKEMKLVYVFFIETRLGHSLPYSSQMSWQTSSLLSAAFPTAPFWPTVVKVYDNFRGFFGCLRNFIWLNICCSTEFGTVPNTGTETSWVAWKVEGPM